MRIIGPIEALCCYCTAWERGQLSDEHKHLIKLDYDNTCDTITLCLDGKVMFAIDLVEWQKIHKQLEAIIRRLEMRDFLDSMYHGNVVIDDAPKDTVCLFNPKYKTVPVGDGITNA